MTCIRCQHQTCKRFGFFGKRRIQRWRCTSCNSTFCEPHTRLTRDTLLSKPDAAARAVQCLLEGCSIRSTERLTGINRNTIMRLLIVSGEPSEHLLDNRLRDLRPKRIQCDEIWTFVQKKARSRRFEPGEAGDQWIFVAMDADTKMVLNYEVGKRTRETTGNFLLGLQRTLSTERFQITTDGFHFYRAISGIFGTQVDFAQLIKPVRRFRPA